MIRIDGSPLAWLVSSTSGLGWLFVLSQLISINWHHPLCYHLLRLLIWLAACIINIKSPEGKFRVIFYCQCLYLPASYKFRLSHQIWGCSFFDESEWIKHNAAKNNHLTNQGLVARRVTYAFSGVVNVLRDFCGGLCWFFWMDTGRSLGTESKTRSLDDAKRVNRSGTRRWR